MQDNFLKLKMEFMIIGSRQQLSKVSIPNITIGDSEITPVAQADKTISHIRLPVYLPCL